MDDNAQKFKAGNVLSIASVHLLHDVFSSFFAPLIPLLTEKLGFTYAVAGMLSVIQRVPSLLNPMIGLIADRLVIRSAIIAMPIATTISMSLLGIAPSITVLGILFFACGVSAAVFHVTAPVLVRHVSGNRIGRGMSFFMFGGEMARTLGPLLITAAVSWWGIEGTWRLIPFGLAASLLLFLNLRTIDKHQIRRFREANKAPLQRTVRKILRFFALITPILFFRAFLKTPLTLFLPAYMVDSGSSIKTAAVALAVLQLTGSAGALLAGSLSDHAGRKNVLLTVMLLGPLLLYLFTTITGIGQWILLGLMGLILFAATPVFMAMIHDLNTDRPSFTNGLFMTVNFIAGSTVALLAGLLADRYGLVMTYQITAALGIFAIPFTLLLPGPDARGKRST